MLPPNISFIIFDSVGFFSLVSNIERDGIPTALDGILTAERDGIPTAERDGIPTATISISAATISGAGKFSESPVTAFTLKSLDIV